MRERIATGFDPFVIPFLIGMIFVLTYCFIGIFRLYYQMPIEDRRKFLLSLINPKTISKNIHDIFTNCLLHVKLWKRNALLGFMHSSIAFGWFMLIVLGHLEVFLYLPHRIRFFYYPIFFNYFVASNNHTIKGGALFFLMDLFLLVVLIGIFLAIVKRVRSRFFGMRRTTNPSFLDLIGQFALWAIFPLRLLAEGFTAHISGGSFLIIPLNWVFRQFLGNDMNMLPTWWAYSISLCVFMCVLPFTRYMHIPAEMMLIPLRNAGLKIRHARRGFARAEIISCPGCGVCIDACPMSVKKANIKDCTVYLNRQIRRGNERRITEISDKCLLCGKCAEVCQVGCEGHTLRIVERAKRRYAINPDYSGIDVAGMKEAARVAVGSGAGPAGVAPAGSVSAGAEAVGSASARAEASGCAEQAARVASAESGVEGRPAGVATGSGAGPAGSASARAEASGCAEQAARVASAESGVEGRPAGGGKVLYFSGCMTALTPRIGKAVQSVLGKAGVNYVWMDKDGGLCCGRPMLTAGRFVQAKQLISKNEEIILSSGADTLLLSCPICYKIFREHYTLPGIRVVHHTRFFEELAAAGLINIEGESKSICYHDPCELGRGCKEYDAPRALLGRCGHMVSAGHEKEMSICCGGSLGSLSLSFKDREPITKAAWEDLVVASPDMVATACPLCLTTFSRYADRPVKDIAEIIDEATQ